jgi:hypothetical protein
MSRDGYCEVYFKALVSYYCPLSMVKMTKLTIVGVGNYGVKFRNSSGPKKFSNSEVDNYFLKVRSKQAIQQLLLSMYNFYDTLCAADMHSAQIDQKHHLFVLFSFVKLNCPLFHKVHSSPGSSITCQCYFVPNGSSIARYYVLVLLCPNRFIHYVLVLLCPKRFIHYALLRVSVTLSHQVHPLRVNATLSQPVHPLRISVTLSQQVNPLRVSVTLSQQVHPLRVSVTLSQQVHPLHVSATKA